MALKARALIPVAAVVAAILATACTPPPPPPPPPPPTTTPTTQPQSTCPAAGTDATPGPNGQNPISSWGINGTGYSVVAIGDIVYVGGTFSQAVGPNPGQTAARADLAAFCIKDGSLVSKFVANTNGQVWALTTDGTSLFAGGSFTSINGQPTNRLVKLDPITGAVDSTFNPPAIPDIVYALGYRAANASIYAGGDFSIAGNQGKKGASFDHVSGAVTGWNPNADARIESLEISPDQSKVFIGGSFDNVGNASHNALARTDPTTGAADAIVYSRLSTPGRIDGRIFSIAVGPDNLTPYVAIGPAKPGGTNGGNKFATYNPTTGNAVWEQNGPDGDAQAIELINGVLYGAFHGGWNGDPQKRLEALSPSSGNPTGTFAPDTGGVLGVRGLAQAGGRLFAVGDFSFMGTTAHLNGVAIFN